MLSGDALTVKLRAQIASVTGEGPSRALQAIRSWDFDRLLVVLFDDSYGIARATEIPVRTAESAADFAPKSNGYVLIATDDFLDEAGNDLTADLQVIERSV